MELPQVHHLQKAKLTPNLGFTLYRFIYWHISHLVTVIGNVGSANSQHRTAIPKSLYL